MRRRWIATLAIVLVSFIVISTTTCPTVTFTDNGELAAVAGTLGIAHPTGYPLFTLIGRLLTMVVPSEQPVRVLNVAATFILALGAGAMFRLLLTLREARAVFGGPTGRSESIEGASAAAALAFAFSTTVWSQGVSWEVYGLQLLLMILTTNAFIRGLQAIRENRTEIPRWFILSAFLLGLGFANHMTTILLLPAFLYLYVAVAGWNVASIRRIGMVVPWSVLALSLYLVLPIRSASGPILDWGGTSELDRLVRHVSGTQYQVWMFSGAAVMKKQFVYFLTHFVEEYHVVFLPLIIAGISAQARRTKRMFWFTLVLLLTTLLYATNYDIFDIDSYFLLAYIAAAFWIAAGMEWIIILLERRMRTMVAMAFSLLVVAGVQVGSNHGRVDQSANTLVEDAVENVCAAIEPGGMLVTSQWDYVISPLWYYQLMEGKRADICVVDKNLLMNRPWYFAQMERTYPGIFDRVRSETDAFLEQLVLFERGEPFNGAVIQARWNAFWEKFLRTSAGVRPVYSDWRLSQEMPSFAFVKPVGLLVRYSEQPFEQREPPLPKYRPVAVRSPLLADLRTMYIGGALQYAQFLGRSGRIESAQKWRDFSQGIEFFAKID